MRIMNDYDQLPEFSLFGGPLQRLGGRLGLVRQGTNSVWLGVALGLLTWGVLVLLGLVQGFGDKLFSLTVVGVHVRLLVAIPLFFIAESWVAPRMTEFVRNIVSSGVVPDAEWSTLAADMASQYVNAFDRKWLRDKKPSGEHLLGTPDMQSLADLSTSVDVVRGMNWIPASRRLLLELAAAVILPLLPLLFLQFRFTQLTARLFEILTGL